MSARFRIYVADATRVDRARLGRIPPEVDRAALEAAIKARESDRLILVAVENRRHVAERIQKRLEAGGFAVMLLDQSTAFQNAVDRVFNVFRRKETPDWMKTPTGSPLERTLPPAHGESSILLDLLPDVRWILALAGILAMSGALYLYVSAKTESGPFRVAAPGEVAGEGLVADIVRQLRELRGTGFLPEGAGQPQRHAGVAVRDPQERSRLATPPLRPLAPPTVRQDLGLDLASVALGLVVAHVLGVILARRHQSARTRWMRRRRFRVEVYAGVALAAVLAPVWAWRLTLARPPPATPELQAAPSRGEAPDAVFAFAPGDRVDNAFAALLREAAERPLAAPDRPFAALLQSLRSGEPLPVSPPPEPVSEPAAEGVDAPPEAAAAAPAIAPEPRPAASPEPPPRRRFRSAPEQRSDSPAAPPPRPVRPSPLRAAFLVALGSLGSLGWHLLSRRREARP